MESCPSNSHKAREENALSSQKKKQITKVTKGTVRTKKKNEMSKLGSTYGETIYHYYNGVLIEKK